jgi:hypothetical protein
MKTVNSAVMECPQECLPESTGIDIRKGMRAL